MKFAIVYWGCINGRHIYKSVLVVTPRKPILGLKGFRSSKAGAEALANEMTRCNMAP